MKLDSYWLDTAPDFNEGADGPVEGAQRCARDRRRLYRSIGRAGTCVAWDVGHGARGGADRGPGIGAQRRTMQHGRRARLRFARGQRRAGTARAFYRAYESAVQTVESIVTQHRIDCDFVRSGKLKLAAKPKHFDKLARTYDVLHREVDQDIELIEPARMRTESRLRWFSWRTVATQRRADAYGQVRRGARAGGGASRGAHFPERGGHADQANRQWRLRRSPRARGVVRADNVLVATGPSRQGPLQWFQQRMAPVGSFIVVTEPLSKGQLDALFPQRRNYVTSLNIGNYFRVTPDNRLLWGGRARFAMSDPRSDAKSGHVLQANLAKYFPELARRESTIAGAVSWTSPWTVFRAPDNTTGFTTRWVTAGTACRCPRIWAA